MAKKGEISGYEEQKKHKPTLRSIIDNIPDENLRKVGIDFLEYLSELRSTPSWYASNSFSVSYKGKRVCLIRIDINYQGADRHLYPNDRFLIHLRAPDMQMLAIYLSELPENERQLYIDKINKCGHCSQCSPGVTVAIGNLWLNDVCNQRMGFTNPTSEQLNIIKRLIELRRKDIADGRA